jgi:uncharacterized protein (TIGR02118 family)
MIRVSVLYPKTSDSHFDMNYYLTKHIPRVKARLQGMGLKGTQVDEGLGSAAPGEPAPFAAIGYLTFDKIENVQQAFGTHGAELMGDIPNFTNVQPQVQISSIVSE